MADSDSDSDVLASDSDSNPSQSDASFMSSLDFKWQHFVYNTRCMQVPLGPFCPALGYHNLGHLVPDERQAHMCGQTFPEGQTKLTCVLTSIADSYGHPYGTSSGLEPHNPSPRVSADNLQQARQDLAPPRNPAEVGKAPSVARQTPSTSCAPVLFSPQSKKQLLLKASYYACPAIPAAQHNALSEQQGYDVLSPGSHSLFSAQFGSVGDGQHGPLNLSPGSDSSSSSEPPAAYLLSCLALDQQSQCYLTPSSESDSPTATSVSDDQRR